MHRILLEGQLWEDKTFVTLTYRPEKEPKGRTVVPEHTQLFIKRLRKAVEPKKIRYFLVGEYGEQNERPHYHVVLYNYPNCRAGRTQYSKEGITCCDRCKLIEEKWTHGQILLDEVNNKTAQYVAGYTVKKMTNGKDKKTAEYLKGRHPEFARQSNRPGIGLFAMDDIASALLEHDVSKLDIDLISLICHGGKQLPLGRYLKEGLRKRIGVEKKTENEWTEKVQELRESLRDDTGALPAGWEVMLEHLVWQEFEGKVARIEGLAKIHPERKTL